MIDNQIKQLELDIEFIRFMKSRLDTGCDIEDYNHCRSVASKEFGLAAAARWDMSGAIKMFKVDNSFGRYKHLSETKKHRKHGKRKNHTVKG
ncbi:MAG: hypothetical protein ACYTEQ_30810 [Planctomycetota bacterium]|jgi:hypothetical protein